MKLTAILLNYKTADMTLEALTHLDAALSALDADIIVVDNDSQDGSEEKLRAAVKDRGLTRCQVVQTGHNGGFGYGNNYGIRLALAGQDPPDYIYLLNSDAFPAEDAVRVLVDFLDQFPDVGVAGSYIHGPDGTPHETAFRFPTVFSELETTVRLGALSKLLDRYVVAMPIPHEPTRVDWLAGASMMIRRQVLEQVGLFDEEFFLYFEETELCRRAARAGWSTWYVPKSRVAHIGSVSTGLKDLEGRVPGFWFDSRRHYFLKTHGRAYLWMANAAHATGSLVWRARRVLEKKPRQDRHMALRDFAAHAIRNP